VTDPNTTLQHLFDTFERSAWRWECQPEYRIDQDALRRWRAGLPDDPARKQPWLRYIRDLTAAGKTWQRVRMLAEPITEYQQWLIEQTRTNIDAGEDIRWTTATATVGLGLPRYDFYLFDDTTLAIMRFGSDMLLEHLDVTLDTDIVAEHQAYRYVVWPLATLHADLLSRTERGT
jgi:hypothetical protein